MTSLDLLLLVAVSVTLGALWGRLSLRPAPFFGSRWAEVTFFLVMAVATTAIYALLTAREAREAVAAVVPAGGSAIGAVIASLVGVFAFLVAPAFASFRATRSKRRSELRGYAFALFAIVGVGLSPLIVELIHRIDETPSESSLSALVVPGVLTTPALLALIFVVTRWRRLQNE